MKHLKPTKPTIDIDVEIDRILYHASKPESYYQSIGSYDPTNEYTLITARGDDSHILAVAHLDSVLPFSTFTYDQITQTVTTETLDDRLGVYVCLDWLPKHGVIVDVLLTTNEESVCSTAGAFSPHKIYKWMVEFDRMGESVVCYQYECKELSKRLRGVGYKRIETGSYSDICELDSLGCLGFNIGVGYSNAHSPYASCDLITLQTNLDRFITFYSKYKDIEFPYDKSGKEFKQARWYDRKKWNGIDWGKYTSYYKKTAVKQTDLTPCDSCRVPFPDSELTFSSRLGYLCQDCLDWCGKYWYDDLDSIR